MKPCSRKALGTSNLLQIFPTGPVVGSVKGTVKKHGVNYKNAMVVLFTKSDFRPLSYQIPDKNGNYNFKGLNTDLSLFVAAFDGSKQFNAVIQDNVVPK